MVGGRWAVGGSRWSVVGGRLYVSAVLGYEKRGWLTRRGEGFQFIGHGGLDLRDMLCALCALCGLRVSVSGPVVCFQPNFQILDGLEAQDGFAEGFVLARLSIDSL